MAEAEALQGEVASMEARMEKHSKEIAELQQELSQVGGAHGLEE